MNNLIIRSLLSTFLASSVIATENQMESLTNDSQTLQATQKSYKTYLENKTPELRFDIIANLNHLLIRQNLEDKDKEEALKIAKDLRAPHLAIRINSYFQKDRTGLIGNLPIELVQHILSYASQDRPIKEVAILLTVSKALHLAMLRTPMHISLFSKWKRRKDGEVEAHIFFNTLIDQFPSLTFLQISNFTLTEDSGQKYINKLMNLASLAVKFSSNRDYKLEYCQDLTKLTSLSLNGIRHTNEDLEVLPKLTHLRVLNFPSGLFPYQGLKHFQALTTLTELKLNLESVFEGEYLSHIETLTNLTILNLTFCSLQGKDLKYLKKLTKLSSLRLEKTKPTADDLRHLSKLTNLQELNFYHSNVPYQGLRHLANLTKLRSLSLYDLDFNDNSDEGFETLPYLPNLSFLEICRDCQGIGVLKYFQRQTNLKSLLLLGSAIKDADFIYLAHFNKLEKLFLCFISIIGTGLSYLQGLTSLIELDCRNILNFDHENMKYMGALTNLTSLNLLNNGLREKDIKHLQNLTKLVKLNISYNKIKDESLAYLKDLRNLTKLDIRGNMIKQTAINAFKLDTPDLKIKEDTN